MPYYPNNMSQGSFNPMEAHLYTTDQIIEFMQTDGLSLQEINQVRDITKLSHDDFLKMLSSEVCSIEDMRACGVPASVINAMREKVMLVNIQKGEWERVRSSSDPEALRTFMKDFPEGPFFSKAEKRLGELTDDMDWKEARAIRTLGAYALYMEDHPEGKHIEEARQRILKLQTEEAEITKDLIEDMKAHPWEYPPSTMTQLMRGGMELSPDAPRPEDDYDEAPAVRFLSRGLRLKFKTLVDNKVIPEGITKEIVETPEFPLPQTTSFSNFPLDRTDIFFLGVPRSGKSTVLSALFYTMFREGRWKHVVNKDRHTGIDPSLQYYQGLLRAVQAHKPPESTATDTISYISMDVPAGMNKQYTAHLNFVEISGEAVEKLSQSIMTNDGSTVVWERLGASNVMRNNNKKVLFFLLDYNTILGNRHGMAELDQELTLKTALDVLTNDGRGKYNQDGCTMSKVESVAILLTKADLMDTDDVQKRTELAMDYLKSNFRGFMNSLSQYCVRFDINHNNGNRPLILTYSAGKFYVGNTMVFNERDTLELASRIEDLVPYKKGGLV